MAETRDGNWLYSMCAHENDPVAWGLCGGFIWGVVDGIATGRTQISRNHDEALRRFNSRLRPICVDEAIVTRDLMTLVAENIRLNPHMADLPASIVTIDILATTMPCTE